MADTINQDVQNHEHKGGNRCQIAKGKSIENPDPSLFETVDSLLHKDEPKNVGVDSHAVLYSTDHEVPLTGGAADQLVLYFKGEVYVFDLVTSQMVNTVMLLLGGNEQVTTETLQNSSGLDDLPSCRSSPVVERTAVAAAAVASSLNDDGLRWGNKKETSGAEKNKKDASVEKNIYYIMKEVAARMKMKKGGVYENNVVASLNDDGLRGENKKETSGVEKNIDYTIMKEVVVRMKREKGGGDECTPFSNYAIMKEVAARMKRKRQGGDGCTSSCKLIISPVLHGRDQEKEKKEEDHEVSSLGTWWWWWH
ncbi:uncharacterized protein LOC124941744 [Impatiens glandulifera]|uniref:uncharacterized protein LOC124941744 n=1 Tax=Impatiens glandulifera TaxID=253017 RepID=UPI001FB169BB|nr:uncharacterized protein LOC124941744 [Impatiens glandulifera]XP_047338051.1 uncharacterized protein LOC124941744 [Impatiens glandulifera]XP_047338052.1 uncharacterized protein LOC124941744 [Impatiens glandulifera]